MQLLPLSGLLPVSSLKAKTALPFVDDCHTTPDIEGPFYIPDMPFAEDFAASGSPGTKLFITGTVYARDCMTPLKEALCRCLGG